MILTNLQRLAGIPLLATILSFGMPIGRDIEEAREIWIEELANITFETTRSIGAGDFVGTVVPLLIYLFSLYCIIRGCLGFALHVGRIIWPIAIIPFFILLSLFWSDVPGRVLFNAVHAAGLIFVIISAAWRYYEAIPSMVRHISFALLATCLIHILFIFMLPNFTISIDGRWRGLTTHANTLGLVAYLTLFFLLAASFVGVSKILVFLGIFVSILLIAGADSMTSAFVAAVSCTWLCLFLWFPRITYNNLSVRGLVLIFLLSVFFLLPLLFLNLIDMVAPAIGRSSNLTGRFDLWYLGFEAFLIKPIWGWGFDSHASIMQNFALPYTNFHNGFIDLAVKGGVLSIFIFIIFLFRWLASLKYLSDDYFFLSTAIIIGFLLHNITEVSTFGFRNLFWILLIMISTVVMIKSDIEKRSLS